MSKKSMSDLSPALGGQSETTGREPSRSGDYYISLALRGEPIPGTLDYDLNIIQQIFREAGEHYVKMLEPVLRFIMRWIP
jgi:hypothetical protein